MIEFFPERAIALSLFGFGVHWYGIMYFCGFVSGFLLLPRLQKYRDLKLSPDDISTVVTAVVLGVILGGRLGYVLFYAPQLFLHDPLEIFAVWHGGMSSHGGFIGVALALLYILPRKHIHFLSFADVAVIPIAIGLAFGRMGNFINLELYGSVTTLPWGIAIPGVEGLRHPTQIYAVIKDLAIAGLCFWYLRTVKPPVPGRTMCIFLMGYGILRFLIEYLRVQDFPSFDAGFITLTRGQLLTIPIFFAGAFLWWFLGQRRQELLQE